MTTYRKDTIVKGVFTSNGVINTSDRKKAREYIEQNQTTVGCLRLVFFFILIAVITGAIWLVNNLDIVNSFLMGI